MGVCAYIAYAMIVIFSNYIYIKKKFQKVFVVNRYPGLYSRIVYTNDDFAFSYPMITLLDYSWILFRNERGLQSTCVYLQEKGRIIGIIKSERTESEYEDINKTKN